MTLVERGTVSDPLDGAFLNNMLAKLGNEATGIVYMTYEVFFCREKAGEFSPRLTQAARHSDRLMEYRFFSNRGEYRVWKYGSEYKYRFRPAEALEEGEETRERTLFLWGNKCRNEPDGAVTLVEKDRGCRFGFPTPIDESRLPLQLKTVDYYTYTDDGLIEFVDMRVVVILDAKGDRL